MHSGTERHGGGAYERPFLLLLTADSGGRLARAEWFDADREAEAVARLDELREAPAQVFSNPVTRLNERFARAWAARDWDAVTAIHSPSCRFDDRRPLMRAHADLEATARTLFEVPNGRWRITPLATRGERLALSRVVFEGDVPEGGGELAIDYLNIDELDDDGRLGSVVMFDPADLDAARAELDACWEAGEGAAHPLASDWLAGYLRAFAGRVWEAMAALFSPDLVSQNHRLVGWGTRHCPEGVISTMQAQFELAPDTRARVDHVRTCERGLILEYAWYGTREGGSFENLWIDVFELDERGRVRRCDVWEPGQIEQALARFAEIEGGTTPPQPFANAATRHAERVGAALEDRDFERFAAGFAADFRNVDRRAHLESGREEWLAAFGPMVELTSGCPSVEVLATRGERWALVQFHWEGAEGDIGPSEMDWLVLIEVDERGDRRLGVTFDPRDLDAAFAELDERYAAGEAAAPAAGWRHLRVALERRDWDAIGDLCAPDLAATDHRLVGFGTRRGQAAVREAQRAMVELAPDARIRTRHLRTSSRGLLAASMWVGTRDGGSFEIPILEVIEVDAQGRVARLDLYDPQHLEAALARFEEITGAAIPDPLAAIARRTEEPRNPSEDA
jgi:hypothetical protein